MSSTIIFKDELIGQRLILKRTKPELELAKIVFDTVNSNREHLRPWMVWEKTTLTIEDSLKYLFDKEEQTKLGKKIEYGIFINGKYIGNIGIFDINLDKKSAEIGYWLSFEFTKKGYMSEALHILEKEAFENFGITRIQIKCDARNEASANVARKSNYVLEGKLRQDSFNEYYGDFRDTLVFSKLKSEFKKD
jgi:ribosomal-protein-serine acetyltransferase